MENFSAIKKFVDYWRDSQGFEVTPVGNCIFPAFITYEFRGSAVEHKTTCRITRNGYEDGKIGIDEAGPLVAEVFHLDFSPDFQTYSYDKKTHSFIVKGKSPKMAGDYRVVIVPIDVTPMNH